MLHMSKVALGVGHPDHLDGYLRFHHDHEGRPVITTRYLPKRAEEIAGSGSLFWVVKHQLVARSPILHFGEAHDRRVAIVLSPDLVRVVARPKRAHQGWRYLEAGDAPRDLGEGDEDALSAMPPALLGRLASMGLV